MKLQLNELGLLFLTLVFLKIAGLITCDWLFVTIPLWLLVLIGLIKWNRKG